MIKLNPKANVLMRTPSEMITQRINNYKAALEAVLSNIDTIEKDISFIAENTIEESCSNSEVDAILGLALIAEKCQLRTLLIFHNKEVKCIKETIALYEKALSHLSKLELK
jgi:hypothetical protein